VPNSTAATQVLRDDLLAQVRTTQRPLTTAQLRHRAPSVPIAGIAVAVFPIREQVYRVLCALERKGLVIRGRAGSREVTWSAAPTHADSEIAALEAALTESTSGPRTDRSDLARTAEHLIAGARTAQRVVAGGDETAAAAAQSRPFIHCAAMLGDIAPAARSTQPATSIGRGQR
jgi:hypothetical protein